MSNVRGRGLMIALDLPDGEERDAVQRQSWEEGLAILPCGARSLRFRPALVFRDEDVERAVAILRSVLRSAGAAGA